VNEKDIIKKIKNLIRQNERLKNALVISEQDKDLLVKENERLKNEKAELLNVLKKWQISMEDSSFDNTVKQYEALRECNKLLERLQESVI
jgi:tRNA(Met) C34 N-acetyltransferase TmcA